MSDLDALRAEVARHHGPARTRPLVALGQALAMEYWRTGPGKPGAEPFLAEALQAFEEAYGNLEAGSFMRGEVAGQRGLLLSVRHLAHQHIGPLPDVSGAVTLLEEALSFPQMPAVVQGLNRVVLGQLFLRRVLGHLQGPQAMTVMMGQRAPVGATADLDRAAELFAAVADGPSAVTEMRDAAATMLKMTDVLRGLFGGSGLRDPMGMMRAFAELQELMQQPVSPSSSMSSLRDLPLAFAGTTLADLPPMDRPTVVVEPPTTDPTPNTARPPVAEPPGDEQSVVAPRGAQPQPPIGEPPVAERFAGASDGVQPSGARPAVAEPHIPAGELRQALLDGLPGPGFDALRPLLDGAGSHLSIDRVDDLVAISSMLVESPGATGPDHILFALALHLRSSMDDDGWGTGEEDVRAAAAALVAGAGALPGEPADTVAFAAGLAALLDDRLPALDVRRRLAGAFSAVAAAVAAVGAGALLYPATSTTFVLTAGSPGLFPLTPATPLPPRILVAGEYIGDGTSAVSHVGCGADVIRLAIRARRPVTESAAFLADPRHDRPRAALDAMLLRRSFYPRSTGYGNTLEQADGPGSPADAAAALGSAMVHLGCGITADGGLELADGAVLDAAGVAGGPGTASGAGPAVAGGLGAGGGAGATGGLAVLPPVTAGADALTRNLLHHRCTAVIGFRERIPDDVASVLYYLLHTHLVDNRMAPAEAVQAVRSWLADPDRSPPDHLPDTYRSPAESGLADPTYARALRCSGV